MDVEHELPLGLSFALAMNEDAMSHFAAMTEQEKSMVIEQARAVSSKAQMQQLVRNIVKRTSNHSE